MRKRGAGAGGVRIRVAQILLLIPFLLLAARAAQLSVDVRGGQLGQRQTDRVLSLAPERGMITDRHGAELALSVDSPSIYADPSRIDDVGRVAAKLAGALGSTPAAIAERIAGRRNFAFIARWVRDDQAKKVAALDLEGVEILLEPRRVYPNQTLAAQVVGFANIDGEGVRGIEQQEDAWLRGLPRQVAVERDARGRLLLNDGDARWDTSGGDIALTIDAALQADAEAALLAAIETTGARAGVAISMSPRTGDILALAEAPRFDPNQFRHLDYHTTRSHSILDASDPGSSLKAFLLAAALDAGSVTPDQRFDCENGEWRVRGGVIHDSHPHGKLSASDILRVSSNIGAAKIAFDLGPQAHYEALRRFGFGEITGVGFPGESPGLLRPWQQWRTIDHATIAFGQGVTVTPLQLAAAAAALANGGEWVRPRLVSARRAADGAWQPAPAAERRRVIRPETAATVLGMMENVVGPEGTARRAALRDVRVAGKTGTAQKLDAATGRYAPNRFTAWFIGIVPADDPELVIVVGIDEAQRPLHTGGAAAAPLFAQMASAQLARFGIVTEPGPYAPRYNPAIEPEASTLVAATSDAAAADTASPVAPDAQPAEPALRNAVVADAAPPMRTHEPLAIDPREAPRVVSLGDRMLLPDFRGLTPSEVRDITVRTSLDVKMTGRGRAVTQEPAAGTILASRQALVFIHFESSNLEDAGGGI